MQAHPDLDGWRIGFIRSLVERICNLLRVGLIIKYGCVFPMVIWSAFRMEKYRFNDHPYHALQFIGLKSISFKLSNFLRESQGEVLDRIFGIGQNDEEDDEAIGESITSEDSSDDDQME